MSLAQNMRRMAVVMLLAVAFLPFLASAQTTPPPEQGTGGAPSNLGTVLQVGGQIIGGTIIRGTLPGPTGAMADQALTGGAGAIGAKVVGDAAGAVTLRAVLGPVALLAWAIFMLASMLLAIAGTLFNFAMQYLVFDFGIWFGNSEGMLVAWGVLRDIGNIVLIFGFIFMGIATILDLHNYSAGKALPRLIIFAVLLNFSLFVAEAVIDTSNLFAATIYKQGYAVAQTCPQVQFAGASQISAEARCGIENGVSGVILQGARLTTIFNGQHDGIESYLDAPLPYVLKYMGLALLVTTATIVLFAGAFLLLSRGVQLAMLMVISPIGFAGMAIPPLQKLANGWWHRLINQALFAPVFLLLLLVALKITQGLASLAQQEGGLGEAFMSNEALDIGPVFFFGLIMAFLILALMAAKKFGIAGADFITNTSRGLVTGVAVGLPMGLAARGSSLAIGGAARAIRRLPGAGPITHGLLKPLESFNADIRRVPGLGVLGAPAKGLATFGEVSKAYEDVKFAKQYKDWKKDQDQEVRDEAAKKKHHEMEKRAEEIEKGLLSGAGFGAGTVGTENKQFYAGLGKNTPIKAMLTVEGAEALTPDTYAQHMDPKNDRLTDVEKEHLQQLRFSRLGNQLAELKDARAAGRTADAERLEKEIQKTVRGFQREDSDNMPSSFYANQDILNAFSDKQREYLEGSKNRTSDEREAIRNSSPHMQFEIKFNEAGSRGDVAAIADLIKDELPRLRPDQAAKLNEEILRVSEVAKALSGATLDALQKERLSNKTIAEIGKINANAKRGTRRAFWT